jgi:hypothetical protein
MKRITALLIFFGITGLLAGSQDYTVSFMVGTAWVKSGTAWEKLNMGDLVSLGDSIKVEAESRVELTRKGETTVKIGAAFKNKLTPQVVAALMPKDRGRSTLSKLSGRKADMEIQTPTAVAAIRGKAAGDLEENGESEFLSEAELSALLQENQTGVAPADPDDSDPEANARALLAEAIKLRAQVDQLLKDNREAAALTTLNMSEKLTQQALNLLGAGTTD